MNEFVYTKEDLDYDAIKENSEYGERLAHVQYANLEIYHSKLKAIIARKLGFDIHVIEYEDWIKLSLEERRQKNKIVEEFSDLSLDEIEQRLK